MTILAAADTRIAADGYDPATVVGMALERRKLVKAMRARVAS